MTKVFSFEKLSVWQDAKMLTIEIYNLSKAFPKEEIYGLTSQVKRSANSVNSNIAEGSARSGKKDQARFYTIAFSSLIETLNHIIIARELEYLTETEYKKTREKITLVAYKINALKKSTETT